MEARKRPLMQSQVFFLAILIGLLFVIWTIFKPFVIIMVLAVLIAVLALPIDNLWEKILPNRLAAFGTLLTVFVIILAPIAGITFALGKEANGVLKDIQSGQFEEDMQALLAVVWRDSTPEERNETISQFWDQIQPTVEKFLREQVASAASALPAVLIGFTVILFVMYYVLVDGGKLLSWIRRAAPLPDKEVDYILYEAHQGVQAVFFGQILTSIIQGALGGLGFFIVGIDGAIFWGAVMAVVSLLPVIGTPIIWLPAVAYLFLQGETVPAIILLAYSGIIVMQVDNFVRPLLIGSRADIHPLFVLLGVLGGVAAFGFVGLFLGPLLVGILVSVLRVWESDYLHPDLVGHKDEVPEKRKKRRGKKFRPTLDEPKIVHD